MNEEYLKKHGYPIGTVLGNPKSLNFEFAGDKYLIVGPLEIEEGDRYGTGYDSRYMQKAVFLANLSTDTTLYILCPNLTLHGECVE